MARLWLLWLGLAVVAPPSASAVVVPTTQTCKPARVSLTYVIPADWACKGPYPYGGVLPGTKAGAVSPASVVTLSILATKTPANASISDYAPTIAADVKQERSQTKDMAISQGTTTIGRSVPAALVSYRLSDAAPQSIGPRGALLRLDYLFVVQGYLYEFIYTAPVLAPGTWTAKDVSEIRTSVKTIRFVIKS